MEIEQLAVERPEALAKVPVDAIVGVDQAKAEEIADAAGFDASVRDQVVEILAEAVGRLRQGGRHARRGQPAGEDARGPGRRARRQGLARRERRVPSPRPRVARRRHRDRPARAQGHGEGPQLRQALRLGRHHRQRRRPRHEHARRRRVRRRGVRRPEAGQLPRHRRRRLGAGHGRRPRDHPGRRRGQGGLRQRLRRHHRVRRGRQRHRAGAADARRQGRAGHQAARRPPRRQQRRPRSADPPRRGQPASWSSWTPWTTPRAAWPSSQPRGPDTMAIFLTENSKILVQGITGSEGTKHTIRMLGSHANIVAGVTPGKGGQTVTAEGRDIPVFNSCQEAVAATGADVSVVFVPPRFAKARRGRGDRRGDPARRRHHRGHRDPRHRRVLPVRRELGHHAHHRPELPRPHQPRQVQRGHHPRHDHQGRPHRPGVASRAR